MQSEVFVLKTAASQEAMNKAVQVLSAVAGVAAVTPSLARNELSVQFNADQASKQSLAAALFNAGYAVQAAGSNGGCGGGGGGCTCGG